MSAIAATTSRSILRHPPCHNHLRRVILTTTTSASIGTATLENEGRTGSGGTAGIAMAATALAVAAVSVFSIGDSDSSEYEAERVKSVLNPTRSLPRLFVDSMAERTGTVQTKTLQRVNTDARHKYQIDRQTLLGSGTFGAVFQAKNYFSGKDVAMKVISKQYADLDSIRNEMEALSRIKSCGGHPNICEFYDIYEDQNNFYVAMDLVVGGEVFDDVINRGVYSEERASILMKQIASALAFLHSSNVRLVHGDLKLENLLLTSEDRKEVQIIDFGCAVSIMSPDQCTDAGTQTTEQKSSGTSAYWSPERIKGADLVPSSDMWSVGIILFSMLCGAHPYDLEGTATDDEVEDRILNSPFPYETARHLSPEVVDLLKKLLATDPESRITASEMLKHPWICRLQF